MKRAYKLERVSGDCQLKISFTEIVKKNDVIICTAQILENYLERFNKGEDEGVNLSGMFLQKNPALTQELFRGAVISFLASANLISKPNQR